MPSKLNKCSHITSTQIKVFPNSTEQFYIFAFERCKLSMNVLRQTYDVTETGTTKTEKTPHETRDDLAAMKTNQV